MTPRAPITNRTKKGGWVKPADLLRDDAGRALCRWCNVPVPKGRRTFCAETCVHEWKLRTNPGYLREAVFERDKGICALCHVNTSTVRRDMKKLDYAARKKFLKDWGLKEGSRKSLWDADHILPVVEGGGQCDLANMRTLCLRCHRAETARLIARVKAARASLDATS